MSKVLKTHGTTFTVGLFFVSTVSGVFLFFHIGSATFHAMHEWLSMVLLLPVAFHVWKNWSGFKGYFKKKTIVWPMALSLVAAVAFAYPSLTSSGTGGNPLRATLGGIQSSTIAQVAPIYKLSAEQLTARLKAKGYTISNPDQPLSAIAKASGKELGPPLIGDIAFE